MNAVRAASAPAGQRWVRLLSALLPAEFRDRQRGEWTADLLMLSQDPAARRRYLLAAARTLPSLRAAARGHDSVLATPAGAGVVTAWRVVTWMLAWSTVGWLTTVAVPYWIERNGGDAAAFGGREWITDAPPALVPVAGVLLPGGFATVYGPLLTVVASVTALVLAVAERRRSREQRIATGAAAALLVIFVAPLQLQFLGRAAGDSLVMLALAAVALLTRRAGLSVGRRAVVGVLAVAAVAIAVYYHTPDGQLMVNWLED